MRSCTHVEGSRKVFSLQVLETSHHIAEAFRLQHDAAAARAAGEQFAHEVGELEAALAAQRAGHAPLDRTDAAKLGEVALYYEGLGEILAACCELPPTASAKGPAYKAR